MRSPGVRAERRDAGANALVTSNRLARLNSHHCSRWCGSAPARFAAPVFVSAVKVARLNSHHCSRWGGSAPARFAAPVFVSAVKEAGRYGPRLAAVQTKLRAQMLWSRSRLSRAIFNTQAPASCSSCPAGRTGASARWRLDGAAKPRTENPDGNRLGGPR